MKKTILAAAMATALILAPLSMVFAQATAKRPPGAARSRVAHHQQRERERLPQHQKRERQAAREAGVTGQQRARLAHHEKNERERLKAHQQRERERFKERVREHRQAEGAGTTPPVAPSP